MSTDPYQAPLQDSVNEFNYWHAQFVTDYNTTQDAIKSTIDSSDSFESMIFAIMNILPDCINQLGDLLGEISGQLDIMSAISSYISSMESYFGEGGSITNQDADTYLTEMQDLYKDLGGTGSPTGDANPPPIGWLNKDDQVELLGYMDNISSAYAAEAGYGNPSAATPMQLQHSTSTSDNTLKIAQDSWAQQVSPTDGSPQEDGNFNTVNMGFEQMNTKVTSINQSLTTQQNMWSNELNEYQATDTDAQQYISTVDGNSVNNEIPK